MVDEEFITGVINSEFQSLYALTYEGIRTFSIANFCEYIMCVIPSEI